MLAIEPWIWLAKTLPMRRSSGFYDVAGQPNAFGVVIAAMQDVTMLFFTVVFFAMAFLYVKGCEKLR